jgi:hypothetical protein
VATHIITFEEETQKPAGQTINPESVQDRLPQRLAQIPDNNPYAPFPCREDYELAKWFSAAGISKTNITTFLQNRMLHPVGPGRIQAYTDYKKCLDDIPYGIGDGDKWTRTSISIQLPGQDRSCIDCPLLYRDIRACLEFLLGFEPFANGLFWAPERRYRGSKTEGSRLYNEMHTAEWWWETQAKLPHGATVVPVILGSDKTQLTHFHGDVSAWPVYVTIGNLSREIRRAQAVPSILLLGFIPVVKKVTRNTFQKEARDMKAKIYHESMRLMLKRKLNSS